MTKELNLVKICLSGYGIKPRCRKESHIFKEITDIKPDDLTLEKTEQLLNQAKELIKNQIKQPRRFQLQFNKCSEVTHENGFVCQTSDIFPFKEISIAL